MKAIVLETPGGVENFIYMEVPQPNINDDAVLIKTQFISVNPVDFKARSNEGTMSWLFGAVRPVILGWDVCGTVVATGKNVSEFKSGDVVFGMINFPGSGAAYAEYVSAPSAHLALKPENISEAEAAAASLAALTAWQAIVTNGGVKKDDVVLVYGASGGVGHYAVQIAKHIGAYVIGVSSGKNKDFVMSLGADEHIDYTTNDVATAVKNVQLVLAATGAAAVMGALNYTRSGGKIITIAGGATEEAKKAAADKGIELMAMMVQSSGADMKSLASLLQEGIIKSHVSQRFSFDQMAAAHQQLQTGRTVGKIVVEL